MPFSYFSTLLSRHILLIFTKSIFLQLCLLYVQTTYMLSKLHQYILMSCLGINEIYFARIRFTQYFFLHWKTRCHVGSWDLQVQRVRFPFNLWSLSVLLLSFLLAIEFWLTQFSSADITISFSCGDIAAYTSTKWKYLKKGFQRLVSESLLIVH